LSFVITGGTLRPENWKFFPQSQKNKQKVVFLSEKNPENGEGLIA